ncbi:MAG: hypothetical protein FWC79_07185 [Oscillospiraceae bacterium]|nr:hypothetical protein [Oscillospiraceae bacterium]
MKNKKILLLFLGIIAIILLILAILHMFWPIMNETSKADSGVLVTPTSSEMLNWHLQTIRDENQNYSYGTRFTLLYSIYHHNDISSDEFYELYNLLGRN